MNVSKWKTPTAFFPWPHVQRHIDSIDPNMFPTSREFAQERFIERAKPCPGCASAAGALKWFGITSPEEAWDKGTGRVGWLTICESCESQVDFFVDEELTEMQAKQWRDHRALY